MRIGLGLAITQPSGMSLDAAIRALFASNEQGVWFDPSDFSTMYQDSAGTTPVTAVGQPVGMILDRRKGLVFSGNKVAITEMTVAQLAASGGSLATDSTPGDSLHTTWVRFAGNTTSAYAYTAPPIPSRVASFQIDIEMLDADTPPILNGGSGSANGLLIMFGDPAASTATITKIAPYRYRVNVPRYRASAGGANFGIVVYDTNTFRPMRISGWEVRELPGNHATQPTAASRPILQQDELGKHYLSFDGVDDWLVTPSIDFTGTDKVTVIAGVRKNSDSTGMIVELGNAPSDATFLLYGRTDGYDWYSRGSATVAVAISAGYPAPDTSVLTAVGDIANDVCALRIRGVQVGSTGADQGTGNYRNDILYIGRRGGTSIPFNGRLYGLIVRGASTPDVTPAERYVASKTGITL